MMDSGRSAFKSTIHSDSLTQSTPILNSKERTLQPGDAFEDTALFKPWFEIVKLGTGL